MDQLIVVSKDSPMMEYPVMFNNNGQNITAEYIRLPKGLKFTHIDNQSIDDAYTSSRSYWTCFRLDKKLQAALPGWLKKLKLHQRNCNVYILADLCFVYLNSCNIKPKYVIMYDDMVLLIHLDEYYMISVNKDSYYIDIAMQFQQVINPLKYSVIRLAYPCELIQWKKKANEFFYLNPELRRIEEFQMTTNYFDEHTILFSNHPEVKALFDALRDDAINQMYGNGSKYTLSDHPAINNNEFLQNHMSTLHSRLQDQSAWIQDLMQAYSKCDEIQYGQVVLKLKDAISAIGTIANNQLIDVKLEQQ